MAELTELEKARQAKALAAMQRDMRTTRETNDENLGTEEERIAAIKKRCKDAGYDVGPDPDAPLEWRYSAVR